MRHIAVLFTALLSAAPLQAAEVRVFAAASLQGTLEPIAAAFEQAGGDKVRLTYAGSSLLARQIIAGAPADVFLSASPEWMDAVEAAGGLAPGTRRDLLGNALVMVGADPAPAKLTAEALAARLGAEPGGRLAIALVDSVPAGRYGKQALTHLGLWDTVSTRLAQTDDVRGALSLVAAGEAPLGIVYATDAAAEPRVHVVARFPGDSHDPIIYPVALTSAGDAADRRFLDALRSPESQAVFAAQGFTVLP